MRFWKWIKDIIVFVYEDFKKDIITIRDMIRRAKKDEPLIDPEVRAEWKHTFNSFTPKRFLSENWLLFLCCFLTLLLGIFMSAKHYENKCNDVLMDTCREGLTGYNITQIKSENISTLDYFIEIQTNEEGRTNGKKEKKES